MNTPSDKVRRQDRQITDKKMIEQFLSEQLELVIMIKKMMKYILSQLTMDIP